MADEKTTKRERRDEAKRRRLEEIKRRQRRARMRKIYTWVGVAAVVAGIAAAVIVAAQGKSKTDQQLAAIAATGGCQPIQNFAEEGHNHVPRPQTVQYKTNPPTSGDHWSDAQSPTTTGIHTDPVPNEELVHNLEHGHIEIQYLPTLPLAVLDQLKTLVNSDSSWYLLAPSTTIPDPVDITAWTHMQRCTTPNAHTVDVIKAFHDKFKDHGRESIPGIPT
jgi:Protein of unknown function (DUF3105)